MPRVAILRALPGCIWGPSQPLGLRRGLGGSGRAPGALGGPLGPFWLPWAPGALEGPRIPVVSLSVYGPFGPLGSLWEASGALLEPLEALWGPGRPFGALGRPPRGLPGGQNGPLGLDRPGRVYWAPGLDLPLKPLKTGVFKGPKGPWEAPGRPLGGPGAHSGTPSGRASYPKGYVEQPYFGQRGSRGPPNGPISEPF